jgi:hypothetical protein
VCEKTGASCVHGFIPSSSEGRVSDPPLILFLPSGGGQKTAAFLLPFTEGWLPLFPMACSLLARRRGGHSTSEGLPQEHACSSILAPSRPVQQTGAPWVRSGWPDPCCMLDCYLPYQYVTSSQPFHHLGAYLANVSFREPVSLSYLIHTAVTKGGCQHTPFPDFPLNGPTHVRYISQTGLLSLNGDAVMILVGQRGSPLQN